MSTRAEAGRPTREDADRWFMRLRDTACHGVFSRHHANQSEWLRFAYGHHDPAWGWWRSLSDERAVDIFKQETGR